MGGFRWKRKPEWGGMSSNQQWHHIRPSPGVPTKKVSLGPFNNFLLTYKIGRGAVLGVCCCAQAFSRCVEGRLLSSCSTWASRCRGFSRCGAWALCVGFSSCGTQAHSSRAQKLLVHRFSCPVACGISSDRGSNPCPLHQQVDYLPEGHQRNPLW